MKNEKGFALIEVIIAIALLGIIGVAFLGGLATASRALFIADERATAESLARSQMEYVKSQPYSDNGTYDGIDSIPGYTILWDAISGNVSDNETGIQKITVTVSHLGKLIITSGNSTLEGYKVDR